MFAAEDAGATDNLALLRLAVDLENNLLTIHFEENIGHFHVKLSAEPELSRSSWDCRNAESRIWHVNEKGEYRFFHTAEVEINSQVLFTYSSAVRFSA